MHYTEAPVTVPHVADSVPVQITTTPSNVPGAINQMHCVNQPVLLTQYRPTTTNRILLHPYFWSNCYGTTATASDSRFPDDITLHNS